MSKITSSMSNEILQLYRSCFKNIQIVIIDEISIISAQLLKILNLRLQEITCNFDDIFGNMNIIFCGDLYQLPHVLATAIYKRCKNNFNNEIISQSLEYFPLTQII